MYGILLSRICTVSTKYADFPQTYISPTYFQLYDVKLYHWLKKAVILALYYLM